MAFCPNCGTKLPEGGKFCSNCGASAAPVTPVTPTPVIQEKPVKVKGKINWTVFIIMMLIGVLILGAGAAVVIDILDDGEFTLFGLLDSDSDEDEDEGEDDEDDKDDKEDDEDKDNEDQDRDEDDKDDNKYPNATTGPVVDEEEPPVQQMPQEPTEDEDVSAEPWCYYYYNGINFSLPPSFEEDSPGYYLDTEGDTEIMVVFDELATWEERMGVSDISDNEDFMTAFRDYKGGTLYIENGYLVVASDREDGYIFFTCYVLDDQVCFIQTITPLSWKAIKYNYANIMQSVFFD